MCVPNLVPIGPQTAKCICLEGYTHTHARMHARTHARTRTHTHSPIYIDIDSLAAEWIIVPIMGTGARQSILVRFMNIYGGLANDRIKAVDRKQN